MKINFPPNNDSKCGLFKIQDESQKKTLCHVSMELENLEYLESTAVSVLYKNDVDDIFPKTRISV
jgi:hypothetical protein